MEPNYIAALFFLILVIGKIINIRLVGYLLNHFRKRHLITPNINLALLGDPDTYIGIGTDFILLGIRMRIWSLLFRLIRILLFFCCG